MERPVQDPLILGRFKNNTGMPLTVTVQSCTELHLQPEETSRMFPIILDRLMAMNLNIKDADGNDLSDPILIWESTSGEVRHIFQQVNRHWAWEQVEVIAAQLEGYHFNLETDGGTLVIIGTVELVEEDLVREGVSA
ncbi:MAG: hypothetical protein U0176_00310 [Bacteroidia bacterium]